MKNFMVLLFFILVCKTSVKSQYFQIGFSLGGGLNYNTIQEAEVSPYQTKNTLVYSYYLDISYRLSKRMFIETNLGTQMISSFIERKQSYTDTNNLYSNFGFSSGVFNIPLYFNYEILTIHNKYSLRGLIGINNLFTTEKVGYYSTEETPNTTLFDKIEYNMPKDYSICLVGGLSMEKQCKRGKRLGLKLLYQQGFKEIAFIDVHYSFNSILLDKTTKNYNNGSQLNLCIYYYWGPLGKKYAIK